MPWDMHPFLEDGVPDTHRRSRTWDTIQTSGQAGFRLAAPSYRKLCALLCRG